jgi:hypothetical protein
MSYLAIVAVVISFIIAIFFGYTCSKIMSTPISSPGDHYKATFNELYYTQKIGRNGTAAPGTQFLVVNMTVINQASHNWTVRFEHFGLSYHIGKYGHGASTETCTPYLRVHLDIEHQTTILAKSNVTGKLCYSVPMNGTPTEISYHWASEGGYVDFPIDHTKITQYVNHPPMANAGADQTVFKRTDVQFDASKSTDPDGVETLAYLWEFEGGDPPSNDIRPTNYYPSIGRYPVMLKVTDEFGAVSEDTVNITVTTQLEITIIGQGRVDNNKSYLYQQLWVRILIRNISPQMHYFLTTDTFRVVTENGTSYPYDGYNASFGGLPSAMNPGQQITWEPCFDVPMGQAPKTLLYSNEVTVQF